MFQVGALSRNLLPCIWWCGSSTVLFIISSACFDEINLFWTLLCVLCVACVFLEFLRDIVLLTNCATKRVVVELVFFSVFRGGRVFGFLV